MGTKDFDNILDDCISRMLAGETIEQCLQDYPEHAPELKPLLQAGYMAHKESSVEPRPEFKVQAKHEILSTLDAKNRERAKKREPWTFPLFGWQPRWAVSTAAVFIILVITCGGTVAASSNSMPGDFLYRVKLATEEVRLALTFSDMEKAELRAEYADRRVDEIIHLAKSNNTEEVQGTTTRLTNQLEAIQEIAVERKDEPNKFGELSKLRDLLVQHRNETQTAFQDAETGTSENTRPILRQALERYQQNSADAIEATGGTVTDNDPSEEPAGNTDDPTQPSGENTGTVNDPSGQDDPSAENSDITNGSPGHTEPSSESPDSPLGTESPDDDNTHTDLNS